MRINSGRLRLASLLDSRSEWETMLEQGIEQLGLRTEEKDFPFQNASNVYASSFMEANLSFVATARAELLPPQGPVKISITGEVNEELEDRADRVEAWMNYFLTEIAEEYYADTEQALEWCALHGSVFKKTYFDPTLGRPTSLYIKPQNFIVNYGASALQTASRITEILMLSKRDIKIRQASGMYRKQDIKPNDEFSMDDDGIQEKVQSIVGLDKPDYDYDGDKQYILYESHCDLLIDNLKEHVDPSLDGVPLPYIVTLDAESKKILSIYRNWEEGDTYCKKDNHFTHLMFLPGLGFYGYGLAHVAGGSAKAATILLRQLIDAGMLNNFPGGLRVAGMRLKDNNIRVGPTEFIEIETGGLPIQQAVMPMPYKEPSSILYQLYEKLEGNVGRLSAAGDAPLADFNPNAPVGTTLALLEQTHKVQSSIIRRLHQAFKHEYKLLFKLFGKCLPDSPYPFNVVGGQKSIMKSDFSEQLSIVPVSDPNLSSHTHRLIVWEAILKNADAHPTLHNMREVVKKYYEALKVPDIDAILLPPPQDAQPLDPISENQNAMQGKPVKAALEQDHQSHIQVHQSMLQDPNMAQTNPQLAQTLQAHIQEHTAMQYLLQMQQQIGFEMPQDPSQIPPEMQNQIAMAAAQTIQQQQQQQQEQAPPDPALLTAQALMEDVKIKGKKVEQDAKENEMKNELERMKLETQRAELEHKMHIDEMRMEVEKFKVEMQAQIQLMKTAPQPQMMEM